MSNPGLTLPETYAQQANGLARSQPVVWEAVATASLTSLIAFSIQVEHEGVTGRIRFAMNLPETGFPEGRASQIVRHMIGNRQGFFRYLRFLLATEDQHIEHMENRTTPASPSTRRLRLLYWRPRPSDRRASISTRGAMPSITGTCPAILWIWSSGRDESIVTKDMPCARM